MNWNPEAHYNDLQWIETHNVLKACIKFKKRQDK